MYRYMNKRVISIWERNNTDTTSFDRLHFKRH